MTPRFQPKAHDNRVDRRCRKFMIAGIAAWISALTVFSAGHILNNIEHVHLVKATSAFKELVAADICRTADAEPSTAIPSLHARPVGSTQNTYNTDFATLHTCTGWGDCLPKGDK
jgi:hypothetical protein